MKTFIISAVRKILFFGYYIYSSIAVPVSYNLSHKKGALSYLSEKDFSVWKKAMLNMLKEYCLAGYNFRIRQVIRTFAKAEIIVERKNTPCARELPIVVLCVKNDLKRIRMLVEHYRS